MSQLLPLGSALVVLMIDSAIELAMVSSMVGYLHRSGANQYPFINPEGTVSLINAKPKGLLLNEGHTSNGAAGTSLVLISFGGFLTLWWQRRRERTSRAQSPSRIFLTYTIFTILAFFLTLAALAYTFTVYNQTKNQVIDTAIAAVYQGRAYPADKWTPQTWTIALLDIVTDERSASYLRHWLRVMQGWRWNLIPLFLINGVVAGLAVKEALRQRKGGDGPRVKGEYVAAETGEVKR